MAEGRQLITYQGLANLVINACKSCRNYNNLNNLPAGYANGYAIREGIGWGGGAIGVTRTTSNSIAAATDAIITNDMNNFLKNNLGIGSYLNCYVNNINYLNYLIDMAVFYTTKMCFVMSNNNGGTSNQMNSNTPNNCCIVYVTANKTYNNIRPLDKVHIQEYNGAIYTISEITAQLQTLINVMSDMNNRTLTNQITFYIG